MHFLKFYQFLIGNKASFLQPYTGDGQDDLYIPKIRNYHPIHD